MPMLRVCLFDHLHIEYADQDLTDAFPPRLQELLAYLFLHGSRPLARELLGSLFWGDSSTSQSRKYLRQALWQIHAITDSHGLSHDLRPFLVDANQVRLNPQAGLWVDALEFERAYAAVQGAAGASLDATKAQALRRAVDLYRGDLLQGWFQDWCLYERERFQNLYLTILDKLMDYSEANGDYEAGLDYGDNSLRYDGARERTHRRLMRLYALAGDRTAALRQYGRCRDALRQELGVKPSATTVALYRRIEREPEPVLPPAAGPLDQDAQLGIQDILRRLGSMQRALDDIQVQLQRLVEHEQPVPQHVTLAANPGPRNGSGNTRHGRHDDRRNETR